MPFQVEERRSRLQFARDAVDSPDVSVAEKFRQILVLYQVENNYGRTYETYSTTLNLEGTDRDVDMMRVGRVALVYQTKDRTMTGAWDQQSRSWVALDAAQYRTAIQRAIGVTSGLSSPAILELPISAPESAQ